MNNVFFVLTIDVEPDCTPTWHYSNPLTFDGVKIGIKEILQPLFNKYGISPTYLINNVVLEDEESIQTFKSLEGNFELGTHLHPEFIDPEKTVYNYSGSKGEANSCYYAPEIEFKKLENITELFKKQFGYCPKSFRAGRFSVGVNTITSLIKLGYKIDTSVTPHLLWTDSTRPDGIDFTVAPEQPYWVKEGTLLDEDNHSKNLLEVPVTIIEKRNNRIFEAVKSVGGLRRKPLFIKNSWLRPVYSHLKDFINITDAVHFKYGKNKVVVINMMFHNIEVMPNLSPYTKNKEDCKFFLNSLSKYFEFIKRQGIMPVTLCQLAEIYEK